MAFELIGKLYQKSNTQQVTATFSKREFVLEVSEQGSNGMAYTNYIPLQLVNQTCSAIDNIIEGSQIKVSFNIRGNKWEKDGQVRYITNLNAWKIEPLQMYNQAPQQTQYQTQPPNATTLANELGASIDSDLPF